MTASPAGSRAGSSAPFVTVIVLNYNARRFIGPCLRSLLASEYPDDSMEIVVVDNASTDGSPDLIRAEFPDAVRVVEAGSNRGFTAGNNLAMREAPGPYVALINPDTKVERDWLRPLVETLEKDPAAGAAQPKLFLFHDRIPVELQSPTFTPGSAGVGGDERSLGLRVRSVRAVAGGACPPVEFRSGFGGAELDEHGCEFRWSLGDAELGLVCLDGGSIRLRLEASAPRPDGNNVPFSVQIGGERVFEGEAGGKTEVFEFDLPADCRGPARPVVQNAGSFPLSDGSSRDRGTVISHGNVYYDWDGPAYSDKREVFSFNGAGVLLRKAMLKAIGYFDESIFMYYEDTDLAIRARRRGWRVVYTPDSVIRHHHSGVAVEWSPFFILHVSRSRLYVILKHWPPAVALRALAGCVAETLRSGSVLARQAIRRPLHKPGELAGFAARLRALLWTLRMLPAALARRVEERRAGPSGPALFGPWLDDR